MKAKKLHAGQETDGILLAQIPSRSTKGEVHDIRLDSSNVVYCDCIGWFFRHRCSHLDDFRLMLARASEKRAKRRTGRKTMKKRP